LDAISPKAK